MGPRPRNRARTHRFSALTFPNPASPRAVVDPTHVQTRNGQCRPYPPVFTSRRVSRPPVFARVCPRPSPTAGSLPPPTSKRYSSPLSPRSLVFLARSAIGPACAVTHSFFSPECRREGENGTGGARGRTRGGALAPVPVRAAPPAVDRSRRASDPIGSRAPPRIERDPPRRGLFQPRDDRYEPFIPRPFI